MLSSFLFIFIVNVPSTRISTNFYFFQWKTLPFFVWLPRVLPASCRVFVSALDSRAVALRAQQPQQAGLAARRLWDLSSPTRDWTCIPCAAKWILNHWTTGEPFEFLGRCSVHWLWPWARLRWVAWIHLPISFHQLWLKHFRSASPFLFFLLPPCFSPHSFPPLSLPLCTAPLIYASCAVAECLWFWVCRVWGALPQSQ